MKKVLFLILLSIGTLLTSAQVRLNGYGAYVFEDGYDAFYNSSNYYAGQIDGGFQWGVGVEYMLSPNGCIELMYLRRSTNAPTNFQAGVVNTEKFVDFELSHDYILLGGEGHIPTSSGIVEGYGGLFGGVLFANLDNPDNGDEASATRFAWAARLGANFWASDRVGIKVQMQLISSIRATGGNFYFGAYSTSVGYSTLYQFGLGGGLTFKLGD